MHKKFKVNRTKIKGGCQSYIKTAGWKSWRDFSLVCTFVFRCRLKHFILLCFRVTPEPNKKERAKHQMNAVYGSSSKAGKTRRCGECEGCMRDDCGQCAACADKPRFGGRGSKKKACMTRSCRMRGETVLGGGFFGL